MKKRFETDEMVHIEVAYAEEVTQNPWGGWGRTEVTAKTSKVECNNGRFGVSRWRGPSARLVIAEAAPH